MRPACVVASRVLDEVSVFIQPGVTTREVDIYAASRIKHYGAKSAFLGYRKYPCNICISVNDEVVHGLANERRLQFGDIARHLLLAGGELFDGLPYGGEIARHRLELLLVGRTGGGRGRRDHVRSCLRHGCGFRCIRRGPACIGRDRDRDDWRYRHRRGYGYDRDSGCRDVTIRRDDGSVTHIRRCD